MVRNRNHRKTFPNSPPGLPYLTPEQVARIFQVKQTTVRLWLRRGLLTGIKAGHSWRISQSALEAFTKGE